MILPRIKTLILNRTGMTYRPVPVTATRGYSQQLSSALVNQWRRDGFLPPAPEITAEPPRILPHEIVPNLRRCRGHGIVQTYRCPSGCSVSFMDPVYTDDADLPVSAKPFDGVAESGVSLRRARDKRGRILPERWRVQPATHPDELMTETEVREKLRRVLSHLPRGSKKPFARLCGYRGKWALHTLRGVAKGRAMLPEASRMCLSRILNQLFRGEWVLIKTGMLTTAGHPSHAWRRYESLSAQHRQVAIRL
jgi:hypothetical protein